MESWMTSLVAGTFSSLVVGVIMATFQRNMNKNVEDAKEASSLKFSNLEEKISTLSEKAKNVEFKLDTLNVTITSIDKRVAIVVAEQKYMSEAIKGISEDLKHQAKDYGKVIVKG